MDTNQILMIPDALSKSKTATKSIGDLLSLLGFLGYYLSYIKDISKILKPIIHDLRKLKNQLDIHNNKKILKRVWGADGNGDLNELD